MNILLLLIYSLYFSPKKFIFSFSSFFAVMNKKTVDKTDTIRSSMEAGFLKNIPHVKKIKELYKGCLMYLKRPVSINFVVFSNEYAVSSLRFLSILPLVFIKTKPITAINNA